MPVEHEHSRTSLQTWIAALTLPVAIAGFAERHIPIGIVIAQRYNKASNTELQNQTTNKQTKILEYKESTRIMLAKAWIRFRIRK